MFDCGSEYQGKSLNKKVIWTPGSKKQIFSVLIRHRQKLVAILADIESMFYQVSVVEEHQDFLKFFFSELNDVIKELLDHKIFADVFVATSLLSCYN